MPFTRKALSPPWKHSLHHLINEEYSTTITILLGKYFHGLLRYISEKNKTFHKLDEYNYSHIHNSFITIIVKIIWTFPLRMNCGLFIGRWPITGHLNQEFVWNAIDLYRHDSTPMILMSIITTTKKWKVIWPYNFPIKYTFAFKILT